MFPNIKCGPHTLLASYGSHIDYQNLISGNTMHFILQSGAKEYKIPSLATYRFGQNTISAYIEVNVYINLTDSYCNSIFFKQLTNLS